MFSSYDENVKLKGVEALHGKNETINELLKCRQKLPKERDGDLSISIL
ncbi:hypothetical protein NXW94_30375 [Bacteroides ovatus]|nr:hypothetical protein [Bacteroides ovatus]